MKTNLLNRQSWLSPVCSLPLAVVLIILAAFAPAAGSAATVRAVATFYGTNGAQPYAAMILGNDGCLYGTTSAGGAYDQGTVFRCTSGGQVTTLVSFDGANGAQPLGPLIQLADGTLYGTTSAGGPDGAGTLFCVTPAGALTTLAVFGGNSGTQPQGSLVLNTNDGYLYGTTLNGGDYRSGTLFRAEPLTLQPPQPQVGGTPLERSMTVFTVFSFDGTNWGSSPAGGLTQGADGSLYGTTSAGGSLYHAGTVFQYDPSTNTFTRLFAFSSSNGAGSQAPLVLGSNGRLYGTTTGGGVNDMGTLFRISAGGSFTNLSSFALTNGAKPFAGLVQGDDGNFYGTTTAGGRSGRGAVFSCSSSGGITLLYSFTGGTDGSTPYGGLVQGTNGNFYGVTLAGGRGGRGAIYEVSGFAPYIVSAPTNTMVQSDTTVSLAVVAGGSAPLTYQWLISTNAVKNGRNVSGATTPILTFTNAASANSGSYRVIVKNSYGSVTSSAATLTVVDPYGAGRPIVRIASPSQSTYLSTMAVTVAGTASGTVTVARVYYQLNDAGWQMAIPGRDWSSWTAKVTLSPGPNLFQAYAVNIAGTPSTTNQAVFTPGPFAPVAGIYNGLFYDTNAVTHTNAGFFTVTPTYLGRFTGNLRLGSARFSLYGQFGADGSALVSLPRLNLSPLTVQLQLDPNPGTETINGQVSDTNWVAQLHGNKAVFNGRTSLAPQAGRYTLVLPGADAEGVPAGCSWGTAIVSPTGAIGLRATLADGTVVSQSVPVSRNGDWPLYAPLYGGKGLLLGWLALPSDPALPIDGNVAWVKSQVAGTKYYPDGFVLTNSVSGARYAAPGLGTNVFNATNTIVILTGGNLASPITNYITLNAYSHYANPTGNRLSLSFSPANGSFTGSLLNPVTAKPILFKGALMGSENAAAGFFLGTNESGRVYVGPY